MVVGIVGLGLIGGSAAKAFKEAGYVVYACDINTQIVGYAQLEGTVDAVLSRGNIAQCDLLLLTATPKAVVEYIEQNAEFVAQKTLVIDFCGTKRNVCRRGFALAAAALKQCGNGDGADEGHAGSRRQRGHPETLLAGRGRGEHRGRLFF